MVALDEAKLATVTANLEPSYKRRLIEMPVHNADTICDHILDEITTANIKDSSKGLKIFILCQLSRLRQHTPFRVMTREDLLAFLNTARKNEQEDPKHRWIGNYNSRVRIITLTKNRRSFVRRTISRINQPGDYRSSPKTIELISNQ